MMMNKQRDQFYLIVVMIRYLSSVVQTSRQLHFDVNVRKCKAQFSISFLPNIKV